MNSASGQDANTGTVNKRFITAVRDVGLKAPDRALTYAQVFPTVLSGDRDLKADAYTIEEDIGDASLVTPGTSYPKMKVFGKEVSFTYHEIGLEYSLEKAEVRKAFTNGRPLNLRAVERTIRKVQEKINSCAYLGDSEFGEFAGVLGLSGITTYVGSALTTANLNLANEVLKAYHAIPAEFRESYDYTLVLPDNVFTYLMNYKSDSSNRSWMELIQAVMPRVTIVNENVIKAGAVLADKSTVAAGTCLFLPNNEEAMYMPVGYPVESMVNEAELNNNYDDFYKGKGRVKIAPVAVPFPTSIVKITGWTTA